MTPESLVTLALAVAVFAASPGPAVLAIVARTLAAGPGPGLAFLIGCVLIDVLYLLLAVYGLSYVAELLGDLFVAVKWLGAGYLVWLGIALWRAEPVPPAEARVDRRSSARALAEGALVNLANPKPILFFGAIVPTFVDVASLTGADVALVAAVVAAGLVAVNFVYVVAAARARRLFRSRGAVRLLNRGTGTVMIGAGAALASRQ